MIRYECQLLLRYWPEDLLTLLIYLLYVPFQFLHKKERGTNRMTNRSQIGVRYGGSMEIIHTWGEVQADGRIYRLVDEVNGEKAKPETLGRPYANRVPSSAATRETRRLSPSAMVA